MSCYCEVCEPKEKDWERFQKFLNADPGDKAFDYEGIKWIIHDKTLYMAAAFDSGYLMDIKILPVSYCPCCGRIL